MARKAESEARFYVEETNYGAYITNMTNGQKFFQTQSGQWFLLAGPGSPFDEDATIPPEYSKYLSEIAEITKKSQ